MKFILCLILVAGISAGALRSAPATSFKALRAELKLGEHVLDTGKCKSKNAKECLLCKSWLELAQGLKKCDMPTLGGIADVKKYRMTGFLVGSENGGTGAQWTVFKNEGTQLILKGPLKEGVGVGPDKTWVTSPAGAAVVPGGRVDDLARNTICKAAGCCV